MQRSLALMRARGYMVAVTEHWNQFSHRRVDLFGFADILAVAKEDIRAVQTTTKAHMETRLAKIRSLRAATLWLEGGGIIEVHGWRKLKDGWRASVHAIFSDGENVTWESAPALGTSRAPAKPRSPRSKRPG